MMEVCEVRGEFPDDKYPVVIKGCGNNNLDEIHRDITEDETETNWDAMKMVTE